MADIKAWLEANWDGIMNFFAELYAWIQTL